MQARIRLATEAPRAALLAATLRPELDDAPEGVTMRLVQEDSGLLLECEATDLSGLRAALHSALRLLDTADAVGRVGDERADNA